MVYVFDNKVAIVTGGARGIGLSIVQALIRHGIKGVMIVDIEEEAAQNVVEEIGANKISFIRTDVTNDKQLEDTFKACIAKFGQFGLVINNEGVACENKWNLLVQVNAKAVCCGTLLGFKYMGKDKGGNGGIIINTASVLGIDYLPALPVYTASKHFVTSLSRSMGTDYYFGLTGIRIMCICPGFTKTTMILKHEDQRLHFVGIEKEASKQIMNSMGLIKMLNDGENGSVWIVDGGKEAYVHKTTGIIYA